MEKSRSDRDEQKVVDRTLLLDFSTTLEMTVGKKSTAPFFCHFDQARLKAERVEKSRSDRDEQKVIDRTLLLDFSTALEMTVGKKSTMPPRSAEMTGFLFRPDLNIVQNI